uniref:SFRICE_038727 n=1 Tax=Spodoptera frugiperda TaxID=7108 RepID=A0A2H1W130_SPOFR
MAFLLLYKPVNEQTDNLVSNHRRPWTSETLEALHKCVARLLGNRGLGRGVIGPPVTSLTQHKRCFTLVFCEAVVSLRSSRPIRAEAWKSLASNGIIKQLCVLDKGQ